MVTIPFIYLFRLLLKIAVRCIRWTQLFINKNLLLVVAIIVWVTILKGYIGKDKSNYEALKRYEDEKLQEQLLLEKGTGCRMPELDPFAHEVAQFDVTYPKVVCNPPDWVKCYLSVCKVIEEVFLIHKTVICLYRDIIYLTDKRYNFSRPVKVVGRRKYFLKNSDHVKVYCTSIPRGNSPLTNKSVRKSWGGCVTGLRVTNPKPSPKGREDATSVAVVAFDSTARNGFIRRMPKSYKVLTEELKATVMKRYNIVADGTPGALLPILTGSNQLELPDTRRKWYKNKQMCDDLPLLFYKLRDDGYRTAFFEDQPGLGTFQYRFTGFQSQPTDHYLRSFLMEMSKPNWAKSKPHYCIGDKPQYKLLMNLTNQFLHLNGKKFIFTFISDISHEDFNRIQTADEDFAEFLRRFKSDGFTKDTMLIVMGDHGPRFIQKVRETHQGRLEERLPLMAIVLPDKLKADRPFALKSLRQNVDTLSTPYDIHATLLDAVGFNNDKNHYKVTGADVPRSMSLLERIPQTRSCSEAGITVHWCACHKWRNVTKDNPIYNKASQTLLEYINHVTDHFRSECMLRTLTAVRWVMKLEQPMRSVSTNAASVQKETYMVKITVGPGRGDFEASLTYLVATDEFIIDSREVSRTSLYKREPACISFSFPELNPYCYCRHIVNMLLSLLTVFPRLRTCKL